MIPKISSNELNTMFESSRVELLKIQDKLEDTRNNLSDKLTVIQAEQEYTSKMMNEIIAGNYIKEDTKIALANARYGNFTKYGSTVHAKPIKEPINVFNLNMSGIGEHFFREDVVVLFNDVEKSHYLNILKHDMIKKDIVFDRYTENNLKITIQMKEHLLGPTRFNVIELDPFLPGSFDIERIVIYTYDSNGEINPDGVEMSLENVSKSRIVLDKKYSFYMIDIYLKLNFSTNTSISLTYPFGLKHIYFLDVDFTSDNYVIVPIESEKFISIIKNEMKLQTPSGTRETQIDLENIEIYVDYDERTNELSGQIEPSTPTRRREIARNTRTLYAKIPLTTKESLIAVKFYIEDKQY